jgi:uncharacterized protein (DUF58 family)
MNASDGIRITLSELIEMRHRVREVQLFSTPSQRSPLIGLHHSKLRGRGVDFDQVRVYQAGDDVRTIDWRVTARTQEPHTKLFHEERERPIFIMVEQSCRLFFGSGLMFKSVLAAQAASLIGWAALGHNDRVGGLVFGDNEHYEIKPRRSKQSLLQLLNRLVRSTRACTPKAGNRRPGHGPAPWPRSAAPRQPGDRDLRRTRADRRRRTAAEPARAIATCCCCRCPTRWTTPCPPPGCCVSRRGAQLELDTLNVDLRQAYKAQAEARIARWELLAQKLRILLMPLSTKAKWSSNCASTSTRSARLKQ